MKKLMLLILPFTLCLNAVKAQEFSQGDNYLQVGYGLAVANFGLTMKF